MNIGQIRDGLATRLATISGLRASGYEPDTYNYPVAVVGYPTDTEDLALGGGTNAITLMVRVYVTATSERAAQKALDEYLSSGTSQTKSVIDAIELDKTLGGKADTCDVAGLREYGIETDATGTRYGMFGLAVTIYSDRE